MGRLSTAANPPLQMAVRDKDERAGSEPSDPTRVDLSWFSESCVLSLGTTISGVSWGQSGINGARHQDELWVRATVELDSLAS